jgi:hypothetical protein
LLAFGKPDKIFDENVVPTDLMWLLLLDASSLLLKLSNQPIINTDGANKGRHCRRMQRAASASSQSLCGAS